MASMIHLFRMSNFKKCYRGCFATTLILLINFSLRQFLSQSKESATLSRHRLIVAAAAVANFCSQVEPVVKVSHAGHRLSLIKSWVVELYKCQSPIIVTVKDMNVATTY